MWDNEAKYLLAGSEELSREFNDAAGFYSDFYKEVYGFRPRHLRLIAATYATEAELRDALAVLRAEIADLKVDAKRVFAEEEQRQQRAVLDFEETIRNNMALGLATRERAVAALCDLYGYEAVPGTNGYESLEFDLNLPYKYIEKSFKDKE